MTAPKHTAKAPAAAKEPVEKAAETKAPEPKAPDAEVKETKKAKKGDGRTFTYIGGGDSSPYIINLMGKQVFRRGEETEVTDPDLLAKLPGMATFVEGKADTETLHKIDQEGKEAVELRRAQDLLINAKFAKKHVGE